MDSTAYSQLGLGAATTLLRPLGIPSRLGLGASANITQLLADATIVNDYGTPTFTRASTAFDPYNKVTVASGARRRRAFSIAGTSYSYDLIEGARTNLCIRSSDFTNWATKTDITVTSGAYTPGDGTGTADLITEGTAGTALAKSAAMTITAGRVVTASPRFKKSANNDWVMITVASDTLANGWRVWANINTGAIGTQSAIGTGTVTGTASLVSLGNGEYQLVSSGKVAAAATACQIQINSASADASTTRVNSAAYYAWASQVEMMSATATSGCPSTYIATTTVSVTRAADVLSAAYVLGQAGTILALCIPNGWTVDQDGSTAWDAFTCDDTNTTRQQRSSATALGVGRADSASGNQVGFTHNLTGSLLSQEALTWDSAVPAMIAYQNSILKNSKFTGFSLPFSTNTKVNIGLGTAGFGQFFGWVALLAWSRALTAQELGAIYQIYPLAT